MKKDSANFIMIFLLMVTLVLTHQITSNAYLKNNQISITKINNISILIKQNEAYRLPKIITANMSDKTENNNT